MAVPAMSLELHERGIHAVWTGGPGPRPGGTGVTGARQDAPAPQTPKPRNTRTHWNRGFIEFQLVRPAWLAFRLAWLAFRAAGQLLRCTARADLGLQRGELAVHVRAGPGLVQFLLDVVGAAADVLEHP